MPVRDADDSPAPWGHHHRVAAVWGGCVQVACTVCGGVGECAAPAMVMTGTAAVSTNIDKGPTGLAAPASPYTVVVPTFTFQA